MGFFDARAIGVLFKSLEEAIELSKATNVAKNKIVSAIKDADPDLLRLTNEEKRIIKDMSIFA